MAAQQQRDNRQRPSVTDLQFRPTKRSLPAGVLQEAEPVVLNAPLNDFHRAGGWLLEQLQPGQLDIALELEAPALGILVELSQQVVTF